MEYITCEFCGIRTIRSCLSRHLKQHGKTVRDNTLKREGLLEEYIPKCKFCDNPVEVDHTIKTTCSNPECLKKLHDENKHLGAMKAAKTQIENGNHPFLKQNLQRDTDGKSTMHKASAVKANETRVINGTHPFMSKNLEKDNCGKSILHQKNILSRVENGTHPWLSANLERDSDGKSVMHVKIGKHAAETIKKNESSNLTGKNLEQDDNGKSILHKKIARTRKLQGNLGGCRLHNDDYNPEYIKEHFVKDGKFDLKACCSYFNMTVSPINKFKRENGITAPNETDVHKQQTEVYDFIRSIYSGTVLMDDRCTISPLELDIVIPEKHLAIEFDGLNFHGQGINCLGITVDTDKDYHLHKSEEAEKQGYQLLHIFEDEWTSPVKQEIWKSVLMNKLGVSERIYARKTFIRKVPAELARRFLEENHLQGAVNSLYSYGLYLEDDLVSLMTFGKSRFDKNIDFELLRFCNKHGVTVVGGASKLLKHFVESHPGSLVSYANRRWSNGNLYRALGMEECGMSPPDYFYFKPEEKELKHRMVFQKAKLKDIPGFVFDENKTEVENMLANGYMRIFDCGNLKYKLK